MNSNRIHQITSFHGTYLLILYKCCMCSLSPCIKSTVLRFKIPRESLYIPMDKRAQQLIDPKGISRR